jgi:hypothetical protein
LLVVIGGPSPCNDCKAVPHDHQGVRTKQFKQRKNLGVLPEGFIKENNDILLMTSDFKILK